MSHSITVEEQVVAVVSSDGDRPVEVVVEGVRVIEREIGGDGGSASTLAINNYLAAISLSALRAVRLNGSEQLIYADSSLSPNILGVTFTSAIAGQSPIIILGGLLSDGSFNWDLDFPVFLGSLGQLTQIAPLSGWLIQVGHPVSTDTFVINIHEAIAI